MDYQIIHSYSKDIRESMSNLEEAVKAFIEEGWEPQGGVCCSTQSNDDCGSQQIVLFQAIIKQ